MFNQILSSIDDFVWGVPLIVLILAVGVFLTIRSADSTSATCNQGTFCK